MPMPFFVPGDDPGSNFPELLRRLGANPFPAGASDLSVPHATTCVAMSYADGVVMAGDRRATSGNLISHRTMEKVCEADRHSGVAIAGAAGPAMEMVKLFQLQLEHYEKVEGVQVGQKTFGHHRTPIWLDCCNMPRFQVARIPTS